MKSIKKTSKSKKNKRKINIKQKEKIIEKRYNILIIIIIVVFLILFISLFYIQVIDVDKYKEKLETLTNNVIEGSTAPRGRIYDRNHKIIVDNTPVKVIYYKKQGISTQGEIELAYRLANLLEIDSSSLTKNELKRFWIKNNKDVANAKITEDEWNNLSLRKITSTEIDKLKLERVTEEEIINYSDLDKEAAYIYYLMNKGYTSSEKIIKSKNVTDEEYAKIAALTDELKGVDVRLDWERSYPYGDTLKSILGNVSGYNGIPAELKDYYLDLGYSLDDKVGTSYLEYQYDSYLKGEKSTYVINKYGEKTLLSEGNRGNDIVLTIDIELQKQIEAILEEELIKTKSEPNTEYYNRSFAIVADPNTGEILAMAGKQIVDKNGEYVIYDFIPGIITSPVTVGSVVKGASHIVGYKYGGLNIGEVRNDTCVKVAGTPLKCSWQSLGTLNDITALKMSSNTYQFYTAMRVAGINYFYNTPFKVSEEIFNKYRTIFNQFGLGVKTGIDLPNESTGQIGSSDSGGLLLDFSIGQYDTYTPMQLSQYIGTIANNGSRMQPYLLKEVYSSNKNDGNLEKLIYKNESVILNKVDIEQVYIDRVKEGFKSVLSYGGTGAGFIDLKYNPAGKTGTSQSFIDTNFDGKIDKETITTTFVGFAPADNPKVTFTVVSPDVSHYDNGYTYQSYVNRRIAKRVSNLYFTMYQ